MLHTLEWQLLCTDYHARLLTALVAVSLTLINPCCFRILKSFLTWLFGSVAWLVAEWKKGSVTSEASPQNEQHTSLLPQSVNCYGTVTVSTPQRLHRRHTPLDTAAVSQAPTYAVMHTAESDAIATTNLETTVEHQTTITGRPASAGSATVATERSEPHLQAPDSGSAMLILQESESSREVVYRFVRRCIHRGSHEWDAPSSYMIAIITALFGLFVALTVANVFSSKIKSDEVGPSNSLRCGIWRPDENAGVEATDREYLKNYMEEAQASQYARKCYDSPEPTRTLSCGYFYSQSIKFVTKRHQICPFASPDLCPGGLYSAVTFDTGQVDASILGINSPDSHKFRRTTTCSPLNMSDKYVKNSSEAHNDAKFYYYYGQKGFAGSITNYTYNTSGNRLDWLVPVYSVKYGRILRRRMDIPNADSYLYSTYWWSSLYPESAYWTPLPELQPHYGRTLTILFVASMHIYHVMQSFDPIFPAKQPRYFPGQRNPLYYNEDSRATVLSCVDETELCSPDGKTCWNMASPVPDGVPSSPAYWLMKWSLENSDTYNSIKWRLGSALLAQEKISQSRSRPLDAHQWEVEARQLFATSLARIQYDVRKISLGLDSDLPEYAEVTPDEARGKLCGLYIYKTPEYSNINLLAFIGLIVLAIIVFFLSLNASVLEICTKHQENGNCSNETVQSTAQDDAQSNNPQHGHSSQHGTFTVEDAAPPSRNILVVDVLARSSVSLIMFVLIGSVRLLRACTGSMIRLTRATYHATASLITKLVDQPKARFSNSAPQRS